MPMIIPERGGMVVDISAVWELFLYTGLPEVYNIYCKLREEARQEVRSA